MPTYEYKCDKCDHVLEVEHSINATHKFKCPECGHKSAQRLISCSSFTLKGSGWARDRYGS
jgi:putative FmdB family regulatory protein